MMKRLTHLMAGPAIGLLLAVPAYAAQDSAIGLLLAGPASVAQDTDSSSGSTQNPQISKQPPAPGDTIQPGAMRIETKVQKASEIIGMTVKNRKDEDIGNIEDLAIDPKSGHVAYAAVAVNQVLGLGGKLIAVPLSALVLQPERKVLILDVDQATIKKVAGFDKDNWPDQANVQFATAIDEETEAGMTGTQEPSGTGPASTGGGTPQVSITNPMPHPMNVMADWGEGEKDLGKIQPDETKTFDVAAPVGTEVKLSAIDDEKTHNPSGTVKLSVDSPATWTIK